MIYATYNHFLLHTLGKLIDRLLQLDNMFGKSMDILAHGDT